MGCACKNKVKKIEKLIPEFKLEAPQRKGLMFYWKLIFQTLRNIVVRLLLTIIAIVLVIPFLIIVIIYNAFGGDGITIRLPKKLIKFIQKADNG